MEKNNIALRIAERRKELGLSYQELADRTGISKSTLQRYETGSISSVPLKKLEVLVKGLETTAEHLLGEVLGEGSEILSSNICRVPVFNSVSAGFGCYADSHITSYLPTYIENLSEKDDYLWINVKGDSMAPTIEDGDRILVKKQDSVENGSVAVVMIEEEAFVKKIKYGKNWIELHSFNPYYPVRHLENSDADSIRIVGVVTEVSKKL